MAIMQIDIPDDIVEDVNEAIACFYGYTELVPAEGEGAVQGTMVPNMSKADFCCLQAINFLDGHVKAWANNVAAEVAKEASTAAYANKYKDKMTKA